MKRIIPSLNGLRAMSIFMVIFGHTMLRSLAGTHIPFPVGIFADGAFGVNIFFVISGFLITKLLIEEERIDGNISLKAFYARRAFRIFPAYYFILFVYLILQLAGILWFSGTSWLTSVFYMKYIAGGDWESGHFWSLSVEEHFYLFWPIAFKLFKKRRVSIAIIVIAGVMLVRFNTYFKTIPFSFLTAQESLFLRADALMIGCLTAIYFDKILVFISKHKPAWYIVPFIFLLISFFNSPILTGLNYSNHLHLGIVLIPLGIGTSNGLLTNLLIAILIIISINYSGTYWFAFLNKPFMNYLGKLSYSLYLWQQMFFSEKLGPFGKLPLNLVMIPILALLSYHFIERPFLKLKNRISIRRNLPAIPV